VLGRWIAARRYRRALIEAAAATSPAGIEARLVALERAHREASIAFGPTHPERAVVAYALACAWLEAGRLDHAEARAEEAWDARRAATDRGDGPNDAAIAAARAAIAERQGQPEEQCTARLREWVAACRSEGDREGLGDALNQLALALGRAGKRDDAAALFDEALAPFHEGAAVAKHLAQHIATHRRLTHGRLPDGYGRGGLDSSYWRRRRNLLLNPVKTLAEPVDPCYCKCVSQQHPSLAPYYAATELMRADMNHIPPSSTGSHELVDG
jgi:tetratricopeptide (TPR) repeat protein